MGGVGVKAKNLCVAWRTNPKVRPGGGCPPPPEIVKASSCFSFTAIMDSAFTGVCCESNHSRGFGNVFGGLAAPGVGQLFGFC